MTCSRVVLPLSLFWLTVPLPRSSRQLKLWASKLPKCSYVGFPGVIARTSPPSRFNVVLRPLNFVYGRVILSSNLPLIIHGIWSRLQSYCFNHGGAALRKLFFTALIQLFHEDNVTHWPLVARLFRIESRYWVLPEARSSRVIRFVGQFSELSGIDEEKLTSVRQLPS